MGEERFLPDHMQFFAELMGDSDSDFEGFDEPDQQQPPEDDAVVEDILEQWEEGKRHQPEIDFLQTPGLSSTTLKPNSRFRRWKPTSGLEMTKFLAVVRSTGLIELPNMTDLWSADPVISTPFYPATISRDRFLLLMSFLHLCDNDFYVRRGSPGYNPLFKLGQLFNRVLTRFSTTYRPHQFLSLDEGIVPWRGNLFLKVYNPDKPNKYGIKAYMLCDVVNGYGHKLKLYTGKQLVPLQNLDLHMILSLVW